jgi:hypothetical protein
MMGRTRHAKRLMSIGTLLIALAASSTEASAQAAAYQFNAPPGWAVAAEGDVVTLTPQAEPAGAVQLMILPVKRLQPDFAAQFAAERSALESFWGLRDMQAAPPLRSRSSAGDYAAHFASYASGEGYRYMAFMALGGRGAFGMVIFVASSSDGFNRLSARAADVFNGLGLTADAARLATQ